MNLNTSDKNDWGPRIATIEGELKQVGRDMVQFSENQRQQQKDFGEFAVRIEKQIGDLGISVTTAQAPKPANLAPLLIALGFIITLALAGMTHILQKVDYVDNDARQRDTSMIQAMAQSELAQQKAIELVASNADKEMTQYQASQERNIELLASNLKESNILLADNLKASHEGLVAQFNDVKTNGSPITQVRLAQIIGSIHEENEIANQRFANQIRMDSIIWQKLTGDPLPTEIYFPSINLPASK